MSGHEQTRWRAIGGAKMAWREWDGEFVVFNPRTGSTHLLSEFAGEMLLGLLASDEGITAESLAARQADSSAGTDDSERSIAIASALAEFARLDLVETVTL
ncbi:MAG: HPr-rel-A system PqqD family peptide chaperone [Betaproteobacteria bacterium]